MAHDFETKTTPKQKRGHRSLERSRAFRTAERGAFGSRKTTEVSCFRRVSIFYLIVRSLLRKLGPSAHFIKRKITAGVITSSTPVVWDLDCRNYRIQARPAMKKNSQQETEAKKFEKLRNFPRRNCAQLMATY